MPPEPTSRAHRGNVDIGPDLLNKAKVISTRSGETIAEIITAAARIGIDRRYREAVDAIAAEIDAALNE